MPRYLKIMTKARTTSYDCSSAIERCCSGENKVTGNMNILHTYYRENSLVSTNSGTVGIYRKNAYDSQRRR